MRELAKEHPIPFTSEMVRAILAGRKTQTRRVMKWGMSGDITEYRLSNDNILYMEHLAGCTTFRPRACPYGVPGNLLWVRETFAYAPRGYIYRADWEDGHGQEVIDLPSGETVPLRWISSRYMPRVESRITLEIVNIRLERVQEINEEGAFMEGVTQHLAAELGLSVSESQEEFNFTQARHTFRYLWDSINAKRGFGWDANPWVWVIEFKRIAQ